MLLVTGSQASDFFPNAPQATLQRMHSYLNTILAVVALILAVCCSVVTYTNTHITYIFEM